MKTFSVIQGLTVPANTVVTGASSGIGLAVVQALLQRDDVAQVYAVSRHAVGSEALAALGRTYGNRLQAISADLTCDSDRAALAARLRADAGELHLLFNAAGILHGPGLRPEKSITQVRLQSLAQVFAINAFAPILLAQALLPLMKHAQPAVLASLSARVGSIGDNQLGGWYAYRASKAAQNQLLRTLSVELRRTHPQLTCVLLHPGTVDTPLSQPFQAHVPEEKLFSPARAAQQLLGIVAQVGPADTGGFFAWDRQPIPW